MDSRLFYEDAYISTVTSVLLNIYMYHYPARTSRSKLNLYRRNLTYKTISWLSWVQEWCREVPFVAKIDDDVMVNPFNLLKYLRQYLHDNPAPQSIHGRIRTKPPAHRNGKWGVKKVRPYFWKSSSLIPRILWNNIIFGVTHF